MLCFEMEPDPAFAVIVTTALEIESHLLSEDDDIVAHYPKEITDAFTASELLTEVDRLLQAHRSNSLYDVSQYHWLILYFLIGKTIAKHNDGSPVLSGLEINKIDADALMGIYFLDLDFLIPQEALLTMPMEDKEEMELTSETLGVVCGPKPHPDELKLIAMERPIDWLSPDIYRRCGDYPYLSDDEE